MAKRKAGQLRVLAHEHLVDAEYKLGKKVRAVAIGGNQEDQILVVFAKPELIEAGFECAGPCINRMISTTKVTFVKGAQPVEIPDESEEEEAEVE